MKNITETINYNSNNNNELDISFKEALNNPYFKDLINIRKLDNDLAKKYTSTIEECANEFKNCNNCKGLSFCKNKLEGYMYCPTQNDNIINFDFVACEYLKKQENDNKYKDNVEYFQIPKEITKANIKDIYLDDKNRMDIIKYFKEFIDNYNKGDKPKGLYLHGSFGSGKTFLIAALFNELAKKNIRSGMIYFPEFLRSLKESFSNDGSEYKDKFNHIKKVDLLLLDDIGAENLTPWARDEILGSLLQYRMDEKLPTFFTSNLNLEQLEEHLASTNNKIDKVKARRIIERIKQLTKNEELSSKNRRQ
ncbi:MAG: primosomal protein DnaI [Bacilli bacterium]|nr:primosomal protein DnaI [Bacilli bacterium]